MNYVCVQNHRIVCVQNHGIVCDCLPFSLCLLSSVLTGYPLDITQNKNIYTHHPPHPLLLRITVCVAFKGTVGYSGNVSEKNMKKCVMKC